MKALSSDADQAADPVVVKLSGRLLSPPRAAYLRALRDSLLRASALRPIAVVAGGGPLSREYISALRELGVPEALLDVMGINAARLNALCLSLALYPRAPPRALATLEEAAEALARGFIPVMGGLQPGQSTNAVALSLAEAVGAKLVINALAGVEGVYDGPPGSEGSRLLERVSYEEMEALVAKNPQVAGAYELMDHVALSIARRSSIRVLFVNGEEPALIERAIRGERVVGTLLG
ncbi:MAG: UMP kinase [Acidilobaceae archaeon]|nr:UMP kinase [Acidilobaceae archaeon]